MTKTTAAATATADTGKVRLGGISHALPPQGAGTAGSSGAPRALPTRDCGKVRMGGISRSLPR